VQQNIFPAYGWQVEPGPHSESVLSSKNPHSLNPRLSQVIGVEAGVGIGVVDTGATPPPAWPVCPKSIWSDVPSNVNNEFGSNGNVIYDFVR
jgi:hypothetical protein